MRTVHVVYHHDEDGSWWAESPDLPGYTAVGATLGDVRALVKEGLDFFLESQEVDLRESLAAPSGTSVIGVRWTAEGGLTPLGQSTTSTANTLTLLLTTRRTA